MTHQGASAGDPLEGLIIQGRWRLEKKLGEGGMGAVYLAEQLSIRGRRVAVKVLRGELAHDAEYAARFRSEAERAAALANPRIVTVFDFGVAEDGHLFIVMEYVRGETLSTLIKHGPLPLERAIWFGIQLAGALQRVHDAGVIHRDVKPANVMVMAGSDDLKLMDFGIARVANDDERTHLTRTGIVPGTPAYMAPEQITSGACSIQTDIYAWGVVLYAMLAGRKPFEAATASAIQYMHVHEAPPPLRSFRPDTPASVEAVVLTALAKHPQQRQRRMAEIAAALRLAQRQPVSEEAAPTMIQERPAEPAAPRGRSVWPIAVLAVVGAGGGMVLMSPDIRSRIVTVMQRPDARVTPVETPSVPAPTSEPHPADEGTGASATIVTDAVALAEFFLDRGEYDSAATELERALKSVPGDERLRTALEKTRKAKEAEATVVGGGG